MKTKNNKIIGFFSFVVILLSSCNNSDNSSVAKITRERDSLLEVSAQKDSSLRVFMRDFAEIENNLITVRKKQDILSVHAKSNIELTGDIKDDINENIKAINELMDKNAEKITALNSKLKDSKVAIVDLNTMVDALSLHLILKNNDLIELNKLLMAKNKLILQLGGTAFTMAGVNMNAMDTIKKQKAKLNSAYYILANHNDLKEKNIIDKQGKLNVDLSVEYFKKLDIHQKTTIPQGWRMVTKTAKFLTDHPTASYRFIKDEKGMITNIEITDPDDFWKISKFLVVEVD